MKRNIHPNEHHNLNPWIKESIDLFNGSNYLDQLSEIYPFQVAVPERMDDNLKRKIKMAHSSRNTDELFTLLKKMPKFPYEDPMWYLLKSVHGCFENNPEQVQRITNSLYSMTSEELVVRLEAAPKINTQMGPMFTKWLEKKYKPLILDDFQKSKAGIVVLKASEEVAKTFVNSILNQDLPKRPDLCIKVNAQYIIGEAKWVGQAGGNQGKQVGEVITFCEKQRGPVRRIGIVDGFPWSIKNSSGKLINTKETIQIQECTHDIISALLLDKYLGAFL